MMRVNWGEQVRKYLYGLYHRCPGIAIVALVCVCIAGCAQTTPAKPAARSQEGGTPVAFTLTSSSFAEGEAIPVEHTCDGANKSPELRWNDAPPAQSFVLIADDPDAPGGTFTHWVVFDIPGTQRELPEALSNVGALGTPGTNDFLRTGYGGPCPPRGGGAHRYVFTLSALDIPTLLLPPDASRRAVDAMMRGHIVGQAKLIGHYERL
jgi:Raf kinase inhibitor-like YbhB/YbcL family protein